MIPTGPSPRQPRRTDLRRTATTVLALLVAATSAACAQDEPAHGLQLTAVSYEALPGWRDDDQAEALPALLRSCRVAERRDPEATFGGRLAPSYAGTAGAWRAACEGLADIPAEDEAVRDAIEARFEPHLVSGPDGAEGLFTGYYEPMLRGARERGGPYQVPIHARPDDLVEVELAGYLPDPSVTRFVGQRVGDRLERYPARAGILAGDAAPPVLAWVDDPVDAFFLQVQGSGVIRMADGSELRVAYAGHNGHPYVSIGRKMIDRGWIDRDTASLQTMAAWMRGNTEQAGRLMAENPRYVFFQPATVPAAVGALGVPLTAGRSLAVDPRHVPLGAPMWLDTRMPVTGAPLRRLVAAQDTGGAIKGAVRGDLFWGAGEAALENAGRMKEPGRYYVLLPRTAE